MSKACTVIGDYLKPTFVTLAIALIAVALGAGAYAYYESMTARSNVSNPAPITDAQGSQFAGQIGQFPSFTIHPGKEDTDGSPTSNARLCVNRGTQCFALSTRKLDPQTTYFFGLEPKAERVVIDPTGSVIFFSGEFSAGGSGMLENFALLKYDSQGKISNLLPPIYLEDGGDRQIWKLPSVSPMPIVAFAEHIWAEGEAHYGDHFWKVSVYVFDSKSRRYSKQAQYTTAQKYSDDGPAPLGVLENQKSTIVKKLAGSARLTTQEPASPDRTTPNLDPPIVNDNAPFVPIPTSSEFSALSKGVVSTLVPVGNVEIKSTGGKASIDSDMGAVICPNFDTYGAWYDASVSQYHLEGTLSTPQAMDKMTNDLRTQTREVFHNEILLHRYGCSYLPNGTRAIFEGATSGPLAFITVGFPDGTKIRGVILPERLVSR